MKISVIIPTYNTEILVTRAIKSVLNQHGEHVVEIIIVDDNSTDNTLATVQALNDSRIRIFKQPYNQGAAAARNRGLREMQGEYFAFLDGDDFWYPDFLLKTVAFLEEYPEAIAVGVSQERHVHGRIEIVPSGEAIDYDSPPVLLDDFYEFWLDYGGFCTGSVLMRTSMARKVGGQQENFRICEDLEYYFLLGLHGKWGFVPDILFCCDGGKVTRAQGWLQKSYRRWLAAPTVAEWGERLFSQCQSSELNSLQKLQGQIALQLVYSHLLCGKVQLVFEEVSKYGILFPPGRVSYLLRWGGRHGVIGLKLVMRLLIFREYLRAAIIFVHCQ